MVKCGLYRDFQEFRCIYELFRVLDMIRKRKKTVSGPIDLPQELYLLPLASVQRQLCLFFLSKEWLHIEVVGMINDGILMLKINEETLREYLNVLHQKEET